MAAFLEYEEVRSMMWDYSSSVNTRHQENLPFEAATSIDNDFLTQVPLSNSENQTSGTGIGSNINSHDSKNELHSVSNASRTEIPIGNASVEINDVTSLTTKCKGDIKNGLERYYEKKPAEEATRESKTESRLKSESELELGSRASLGSQSEAESNPRPQLEERADVWQRHLAPIALSFAQRILLRI